MEVKKKKTIFQKIKLRELTNKERFLLTFLAIIILFWISFKFIIDPQINKIDTLKADIDSYLYEVEENNRMLKNADLIVKNKDEMSMKRENIESQFFKSLSQPELIYVLNEFLSVDNIAIDTINFSKPFIEIINEKEIEKMDISVPFKGNFESLNEVIKKIESYPRKMIINSLNIDKALDVEITGDINIGVYSLSGIIDPEFQADEDGLQIEITEDNKSNPFLPYDGYIDPNKKLEESEEGSNDNYFNGENDTENQEDIENEEKDKSKKEDDIKAEDKDKYNIYKAVKGDNISYISKRIYGDESYVDKILELNNMKRSSILPIGKELKLIKLDNK